MYRRRVQLRRVAYPFIVDKMKGKLDIDFVACEPKAVPSTTRGVYTYDFGDAAEMTLLLKMTPSGTIISRPTSTREGFAITERLRPCVT